MNIDDKFSPYLAVHLKPNENNALTLLGKGAVDYADMREEDEIKEIKMEDIKAKVRDDKKFASLQGFAGGMGAFTREHGAFETAAGASAAEGLFRGRATDRMKEGRYGLAIRKANEAKGRGKKKNIPMRAEVNNLDSLNASLQVPTPKRTVVKRGTHNGKSVVQYSDGSVEYGN